MNNENKIQISAWIDNEVLDNLRTILFVKNMGKKRNDRISMTSIVSDSIEKYVEENKALIEKLK